MLRPQLPPGPQLPSALDRSGTESIVRDPGFGSACACRHTAGHHGAAAPPEPARHSLPTPHTGAVVAVLLGGVVLTALMAAVAVSAVAVAVAAVVLRGLLSDRHPRR